MKNTLAKSVRTTAVTSKSAAIITDTIKSDNLQPVAISHLRRYTDPATLPKDSHHTKTLEIGFGQERACKAIATALDINANGYHIFAAGENGLGKRTLITRLLQAHAKQKPTPNDWVYVHNFVDARTPIALDLPAGMGKKLAEDVKTFWLTTKRQLNQRFRSEHYQSKVEAIKNEISLREEQVYHALHEEGKQYSLALALRPSDNKPIFIKSDFSDNRADGNDNDSYNDIEPSDGYLSIKPANKLGRQKSSGKAPVLPLKANQTSSTTTSASNNTSSATNQASFGLTPKSPYVANYQDKNHMQKRLSQLTVELEQIEDEANQTLQALHHSLTRRTLKPLMEPLFDKYQDLPKVRKYLQDVHDDIVNHVERIINEDDEEFLPSHFSPLPARYFVNVIASHAPDQGAPIVFEDLPTHLNLLGHVEQITHLGTVSTDVSLIRAGSLHRANGGYLVLEATNLLEYPYAWQGLKRALQSRQIKMSSLEQMLTLTGSISLEPQPIKLDVKVILLGEPDLYYDLLDFEPEFNAVFKIRADFHDRVVRSHANEQAMTAKIADMISKYQLLTFDNTALACLLDYLSEQAEDQHELSLHGDRLAQLLLEANRHAIINQSELSPENTVTASHVRQAIEDIRHRSGYLRQLFWQELEKGQQLISTQGKAIGQINALTVISYADSEFGMPARLTASVHHSAAHADIVDIERDVDLGGSIHAKGVLIMSSYLKALFAEDHTLNFTASLAFEQSYGGIDGDSATVAETCALLSALSQTPINQSFAVTGSMNQFGQVQAVGGVNAKIAGFYDACVEQGLTGKQGVIVPKANLAQLMLRQDIIDSVTAGKFTIYAVEHVNEAMYLLTGLAPDEMTKKGKYRKNTVYGRIYERLETWEEKDADDKE